MVRKVKNSNALNGLSGIYVHGCISVRRKLTVTDEMAQS